MLPILTVSSLYVAGRVIGFKVLRVNVQLCKCACGVKSGIENKVEI